MKRIFAFLLAISLLTLMSCGGENAERQQLKRNIEIENLSNIS
jgi:hypothetical protein